MFSAPHSNLASPYRFKRLAVLLLLPLLFGLVLQSFNTAHASDEMTLDLVTDSGATGQNITIKGTHVYVCGPYKVCSIVIEQDNSFLFVGLTGLDANGSFSWTGPLPRAGEFTSGDVRKTGTVPTGPISIGVGIPGNALAALDFNVTDNKSGPFSSITAWDQMNFRWYHTDSLVADGTVKRSWLWGPGARLGYFEPYKESPDGWRAVIYYDKARMEVNNYHNVSDGNAYYVSNGLLVNEMVTNRIQTGDNTFEDHLGGGPVLPAGDLTNANRTPPYAVYQQVLGRHDYSDGGIINKYFFRTGEVEAMENYNRYSVTAGHKVPETGHYIASPFWTYLNTTGPVVDLEGGQYVTRTARLFDPLLYAIGLPITEAYWTTTMVGGVNKDVLVQLYERRVLTYTPSNPPGFQVEVGNVGLQYFQWRNGGN